MLLYFLAIIICVESTWDKTYLTWSLENGTNYSFIEDAIAMWDVYPLEFAQVESGKGDIKIYFAPLKDPVVGQAYPDRITIKENVPVDSIFYILQHEFGHALGLTHFNDSVMEPIYSSQNVTERDREIISKLYECKFDSIALINYQTYLMFQGSNYKRLDLHSGYATRGKIWQPFLRNVDSMYRNMTTGNYILIANDVYYEYDHTMHFIAQDYLNKIFPKVEFVDAVMIFRNGKTFVFENTNVYIDNTPPVDIRKIFWPIPKIPIRGAFLQLNGDIVLVDKKHNYIYNSTFHFQRMEQLCKGIRIHCCN